MAYQIQLIIYSNECDIFIIIICALECSFAYFFFAFVDLIIILFYIILSRIGKELQDVENVIIKLITQEISDFTEALLIR